MPKSKGCYCNNAEHHDINKYRFIPLLLNPAHHIGIIYNLPDCTARYEKICKMEGGSVHRVAIEFVDALCCLQQGHCHQF